MKCHAKIIDLLVSQGLIYVQFYTNHRRELKNMPSISFLHSPVTSDKLQFYTNSRMFHKWHSITKFKRGIIKSCLHLRVSRGTASVQAGLNRHTHVLCSPQATRERSPCAPEKTQCSQKQVNKHNFKKENTN